MAAVHSNQDCHMCTKKFTSRAALRNHVRSHLMNEHEYFCELCDNKFQSLEDAQTHASKPCGKIRETVRGTEKESENIIDFDCIECKATFKSQSDYYEHANNCSQVLDPLICDNCNIELVSKAGLKKHMEKCQAMSTKSSSNMAESEEACTNGPDCKFLKQNRCLYNHDEPNKQPWQRVQRRRQGRQEGRKEGRQQRQPREQVQPQQQPPRKQVQSRQQPPRQRVQSRQEDQECRNGPSCIYWKYDRCNFLHSGPKLQSRRRQGVGSRPICQGVDSRPSRQAEDSRPSRQGVDSRPGRQGVDSRPSRQGVDSRPCKFGARCDRILSCTFLPLAKDFLSSQGGRRN
jgi:hypothetical protein